MNIKHILRKDGENDIKLRSRIKKEHQNADLSKTIERLQEQLNEKDLWIGVLKSHLEECWEIIKLYAEHDYLTPEDFYMRDRLERYYRRAGLWNIEDAKKLLEKWGVK